MTSGRAGGNVIQMCRIVPGPSMSASSTVSPAFSCLEGAPLRPPWAVPPAPRAPVGFSKVIARESSERSMREGSSSIDGFYTMHQPLVTTLRTRRTQRIRPSVASCPLRTSCESDVAPAHKILLWVANRPAVRKWQVAVKLPQSPVAILRLGSRTKHDPTREPCSSDSG